MATISPLSSAPSYPATQPATRIITKKEVARHNKEGDAWTILEQNVYNITEFIKTHPGGSGALTSCLGKDGTAIFRVAHRFKPISTLQNYFLGRLEGS